MVTQSLYRVFIGSEPVEVTAGSRQEARELVWRWLGDSQQATKLRTRRQIFGFGFERRPSPNHRLYQSAA